MKKTVLAVVCLLLTAIVVSCGIGGKDGADSASNPPFEYFYRGFATVEAAEMETYPHGTLVIQADADWHDFMDKYLPGIPYSVPVDFTKESLVFTGLFPARPTYSTGADIKTFEVRDNNLKAEYVNGADGISNGIYAQNVNGVEHCFVNVVKMDKENIPHVNNIYHPE